MAVEEEEESEEDLLSPMSCIVPESNRKLTWAKTTSFLSKEALSADVSVTMCHTSSSMIRSASSAEVVVAVAVVVVAPPSDGVAGVEEWTSSLVVCVPQPPHEGKAHCSQPACELSGEDEPVAGGVFISIVNAADEDVDDEAVGCLAA